MGETKSSFVCRRCCSLFLRRFSGRFCGVTIVQLTQVVYHSKEQRDKNVADKTDMIDYGAKQTTVQTKQNLYPNVMCGGFFSTTECQNEIHNQVRFEL